MNDVFCLSCKASVPANCQECPTCGKNPKARPIPPAPVVKEVPSVPLKKEPVYGQLAAVFGVLAVLTIFTKIVPLVCLFSIIALLMVHSARKRNISNAFVQTGSILGGICLVLSTGFMIYVFFWGANAFFDLMRSTR